MRWAGDLTHLRPCGGTRTHGLRGAPGRRRVRPDETGSRTTAPVPMRSRQGRRPGIGLHLRPPPASSERAAATVTFFTHSPSRQMFAGAWGAHGG